MKRAARVSTGRPEEVRRRPLEGQRSRSGGARGRRPLSQGRGGSRRLARTILLGTVAAVAALAWVARELGLDRDELLGYAATSLMLVAVLVLAGAMLGGLLWFIRRERGPRDRDPGR